jgi:hypothetical protein
LVDNYNVTILLYLLNFGNLSKENCDFKLLNV